MAGRYLGLGHVALRSKCYDTMYDFYVHKLGGRELFHLNQDCLAQGKGDESVWLTYIGFGKGAYVELFADGYEGENEYATASFVSLCLEVGNMTLALKAFEAQGLKLYGEPDGRELVPPFAQYGPDECGTLRAYLRDPEGNWIEIQQFTPKSMQIVCA